MLVYIMSEETYINKIYMDLKYLLLGCNSHIDSKKYCDEYTCEYPMHELYIKSLLNKEKYNNSILYDTKYLISLINDISKIEYKENAINFINKIANYEKDIIYKRIFDRLINLKKENIILSVNDKTKKCPHCNVICSGDDNMSYIICGYSDNKKGYNYIGCGKDWCFKCGKKLCKSWYYNFLNDDSNCFHDNSCCLKSVDNNNEKYKNEYCHCLNKNVNRNIGNDDFIDEMNII
jgi:hypothetical protein